MYIWKKNVKIGINTINITITSYISNIESKFPYFKANTYVNLNKFVITLNKLVVLP